MVELIFLVRTIESNVIPAFRAYLDLLNFIASILASASSVFDISITVHSSGLGTNFWQSEMNLDVFSMRMTWWPTRYMLAKHLSCCWGFAVKIESPTPKELKSSYPILGVIRDLTRNLRSVILTTVIIRLRILDRLVSLIRGNLRLVLVILIQWTMKS